MIKSKKGGSIIMDNSATLKYGKGKVKVNLDGLNVVETVTSKEVKKINNIKEEINKVLENPVNSPPFSEIFKKGDRVLIVISDITRGWINYPSFLPEVVNKLNSQGIPDENIIFLTATGTHRTQSDEEKTALTGKDIFTRFEIIDHDCATQKMISIGKTSFNNEVFVNELTKDRKVILTGGITPHLMAGFGGGRKSAIPGISSYETIQRNHLLALDPEAPRSNPLIGLGSVENNPLNQDMKEACALLNPEFLINVTINDEGDLAGIFAGHWYDAWFEGTKWIKENYFIPVEKKADVVITSCGGYPKDINLYQACKTLFNAVNGLKANGSLVFLAECSEGAGADSFFNYLTPLKEGRLDEALRAAFTIPGYIFYAAIEAAKMADVYLVSKMDPEDIKTMGFIPCDDVISAMKLIKEKHKENNETLILPYGGSTVPVPQK